MHLVQALQGAQRHLHGLRLVPQALHGAHELFQEPVRRPAVAGPLVLVAPPLPRLASGVVVRPGGRSRMVILAVAGTFAKPLARLAAKSATSPPTTSMDNDTTAPRPAL